MPDQVIYEAHPAMFRAHPFWFILAVLLIAAFGAGILILLVWYIKTRATTVTVTESDLLYEKGILSKNRTSVSLRHIRSGERHAELRQSSPRGRDHPNLDRRRPARVHHRRHARSAFDQ